jgi:hypothetical protein
LSLGDALIRQAIIISTTRISNISNTIIAIHPLFLCLAIQFRVRTPILSLPVAFCRPLEIRLAVDP